MTQDYLSFSPAIQIYPVQKSVLNHVIVKLYNKRRKKHPAKVLKYFGVCKLAANTVIKEDKLKRSLSNTLPAETRIWYSFTTIISLSLLWYIIKCKSQAGRVMKVFIDMMIFMHRNAYLHTNACHSLNMLISSNYYRCVMSNSSCHVTALYLHLYLRAPWDWRRNRKKISRLTNPFSLCLQSYYFRHRFSLAR